MIAVLCVTLASGPLAAQEIRTVAVDGHRMRVRTSAPMQTDLGQPTVVLESGLGTSLEAWDDVFGKVAVFAPVLAYDRAGVGQSESDGQPPTPQHVANKLRRLVSAVGVKPPYVLVGHSWGGPLIRGFAGTYPQEVAGLVYVDPTDMRSEEDQLAYYKARGYSAEDIPALEARKRARFAAYGPEMKVALELEDRHFDDLRAVRGPDVPVSVLMGARFDPAPWAGEPCTPRDCHDVWVRLRTGWLIRLARESSDGTFTLTTRSGHALPREDPELVVWAIRRVVSAARR